jgi:hypothetical protein
MIDAQVFNRTCKAIRIERSNNCHSERSEVLCAIARLSRDESAFCYAAHNLTTCTIPVFDVQSTYFVITVASTFIPGRSTATSGEILSTMIFTGMRCTTFT